MKRALIFSLPLFLLIVVVAAGVAQAPQTRPQQPAPAPIISPEVQSDNRVTFRFRAPSAGKVMLSREGAKPVEMTKDEQGVWTGTTDPLEPDIYGYTFVADGVSLIDPSNSLMKPNLLNKQSMVHVPGPA